MVDRLKSISRQLAVADSHPVSGRWGRDRCEIWRRVLDLYHDACLH